MSEHDDLKNIPVLTDIVEPGHPVTDPVDKILSESPLSNLDQEPEAGPETAEPESDPAFSFETVDIAEETPEPLIDTLPAASSSITTEQLEQIVAEATNELREALLEDYQQLVQQTLNRELDKLLAQYKVTLHERLQEQLDIRPEESD